MKRIFPLFCPAALLLMLALPSAVHAQAEPTYTLSLGGGNELSIRIDTAGKGGKELHLRAVQKPGSTGKVAVDLRVTLDAEGHAIAAQSTGANFSGAAVELKATVDDSSSMSVLSPAQVGTSPIAAPVVTFVDFLAVMGRRYDWKKGGPQTFVYLDPAIRRKFTTMIVESEGDAQPLRLGTQEDTVPARKLKITVDVPELSLARRVTSLFVGPHGEALKGEMPVTRYTIAASPAGTVSTMGGQEEVVTLYPDGVEPQGNTRFTRVRRTEKGSGYKITYEGPPNLVRGSVETDDAFRSLRMEHAELWRRMTATFTADRVVWSLPEKRVPTALLSEAWFLTNYVFTGVWENRAPFREKAVGESVQVTYPTIEWGDTNGSAYTVTRLKDTTIANPDGKTLTLKHWQVASPPYFAADLWTDGQRLVKLASSMGATIIRDGWATATEKLAAPPKPGR